MISIRNINKTYGKKGDITALSNINLEVERGELYGLIGPDGAGKTTLFRILTTLILPDSGSAQVMDYDVVVQYPQIRKIVGYMPGKFSLYQDLTVQENLSFFATIFNTTIRENYHLIEDIYVQLEPFKNRRAGALSGGMKQKLALCCALIHRPEVLFLDEPTTGVDVVSRKEFWEMLKRYKEAGITIFVSTPYMDEATLCDRIALIQEGKILDIAKPKDLIEDFQPGVFAVKTAEMNRAKNELQSLDENVEAYHFGEYMHVVTENNHLTPKAISDFLDKRGHQEVIIKRTTPTVEDVFMNLMKHASTTTT